MLASERMDNVVVDHSDKIIDGLFDIMSWNQAPRLVGSNELITVSVTYRSPRSEH